MSDAASFWADIPPAKPDIVFLLDGQAKAAADPKINLVIGAYRNAEGKPQVLECVREAERQLAADTSLNKEYLPIDGLKPFREASLRMLFGSTLYDKIAKRTASAQSLSGTGACWVAGTFFAWTAAKKADTRVLLSNPTWANHKPLFLRCGFHDIQEYAYFHPETKGVDIDGMLRDLAAAPDASVVVLHQCAHNPTGADPTQDEWRRIADVVTQKKHLVLFDSAYQGYASGDLDKDAFAARLFAERGLEFAVAQSFAKNMGLYGERVGCVSVITKDEKTAELVQGVLKNVIRPCYSSPPAHGARIAHLVLSTPSLYQQWTTELKGMADRIIAMRKALLDELTNLGTPGSWSHITRQIGMFSYTGLNKEQCDALIARRVFLLPSGRISIAGLTADTAKDLARHIHEVVNAGKL